jgi:polyketide synthase PksN
MMARLLHVPAAQIDRTSSLIELGCDSIVLLSFARAVSERFDVELSAGAIFEHYPSIGQVAAFLASRERGAGAGTAAAGQLAQAV